MSSSKINVIQKIYVLMLAITPVIDSLNGYFIKSGITKGVSIGDVYRGIMIVFILCIWSRHISKVNFGLMFLIIGYLFSISLIQLLFQISRESLISEILNVAQWSIIFILFFSYLDLNRVKILDFKVVDRIFEIWCVITPLTLIVPYILGIGFNTYHDTGYKGFYYATNAITYFLIVLFLYNVFKLIRKITIFRIFQTAMTIFAIAMLGTKSGYVSIIIIPILCIIIQFKRNLLKGVLSVFMIFITFISVGYLFLQTYSEQIVKILGRHSYFSQNSDSFISFITTGRSDRVNMYYSYIKNTKNYIFRVFFGSGYDIERKLGAIEMDYFDAFFMFGLIGLIIISTFTLYVFNKRSKRNNELFIIAYGITIVFSILGGHIWNNALSSTCFAMVCCGLILNKQQESNIEKKDSLLQKSIIEKEG